MKQPTQIRKWVISDTHFFHKNMTAKGWRPPGYEDTIMDNWRRLVTPDDVIIHLGDVIVGQESRLAGVLNELPGKKWLVKGNHDHNSDAWYLRRGFDFVADSFIDGDLMFSHEPIVPLPDWVRLNIHGHFHEPGNAHYLKRRGPYEDYYTANENRYECIWIDESLSPELLEDILKRRNDV